MAATETRDFAQGSENQLEPHHILQDGYFSAQRKTSASASSSSSGTAMRKQYNRPEESPSSSTYTRGEHRLAHRDVRTLPPWIGSFEEGDDVRPTSTSGLLSSPSRAHSAQHHHTPTQPQRRVSQDGYVDTYDDISNLQEKKPETGFFGNHREPVRGRKWDHAREGDPVIMQSGILPTSSPWRNYIKSSMYGPSAQEEGQMVDEGFLQSQTPGYEKPWRGDMGSDDPEKLSGLLYSKKRRRTLFNRVQHILIMHPLVPLIFRVTVLITSVIALGLSSSIHHLSNKYIYAQTPSTTMAVAVDVIAIPYILYITWDEYTGKPLGLRSPKAKMRLVLLDLFFVIFESANLALAFAALADDNGSCRAAVNGYNYVICHRVEALCGILMIALIAWTMTFSVSILRLVERVGGREEGD